MNTNKPQRRWPIGLLVRLGTSVALLAGIVWWLGGVGKVAAIVGRISVSLAALVVIVVMLDRALMTFKWLGLLRAKGIHARFVPAMKLYCASTIWGMFLPATVGADAIRAVGMSRFGINANEVVASIVLERMIGFLCVLLLGLCSLILLFASGLFESRFTILWWAALAMIVSMILALAVSFSERVFDVVHHRLLGRFRDNRIVGKIRKFHEIYRTYSSNKRSLVKFASLTIAEQALTIVLVWLIAMALKIHVGVLCFAVAVPLTLLISRVPIGIEGLGTFEAAFVFFLSLAGISAADALAIAFSGRILEILGWLPWWFAHVMATGRMHPQPARVDSPKVESPNGY